MPPTRGHDLKPTHYRLRCQAARDAPHTGARLETDIDKVAALLEADAPHTGARLETRTVQTQLPTPTDAPHTGARLETERLAKIANERLMPPTRGHDLKRGARPRTSTAGRCPPHGGTT